MAKAYCQMTTSGHVCWQRGASPRKTRVSNQLCENFGKDDLSRFKGKVGIPERSNPTLGADDGVDVATTLSEGKF